MSILGSLHVSATQSARLAVLVNTVSTALHDPANNPVTTLIIIGVVALVVLLLLAMGFLVAAVIEDWRNPPPPPVRTARSSRRDAEGLAPGVLIIWALVVGALLVGLGFAWSYGTSDATCARCHTMNHAFASRKTDPHANVACSRCHVAPGASGAFATVVSGAGNLGVQLFSHPEDKASGEAQVQNAACLSCHRSVTSGIVVAGATRMRHSDVLAVGYACTDCHGSVGHGPDGVAPARYPTMGQCVQCHDGTKATSQCAMCHSHDIGAPAAQKATATDIPKATITPDGCRGCHKMTTCISCHGIELPHSEQFKAGYHARKALLEPQVCMKCHDVATFCNGCHQFTVKNGLPAGPHGDVNAFIAMHKGAGPTTGGGDSSSCYCHTKGGPRQPLCDDCHAPQPSR